MSAEPALAYAEDDEAPAKAAALVLKLRGIGISDINVLRAVEMVPRTLFAPPAFRGHAHADVALPIDCGQVATAPSVVAVMTAALELSDRHSVLEIGTGSGYQTAVLAHLSRRVTTIDRYRTLAKAAEQRFQALDIRNISVLIGDGLLGWRLQAPFDRILVCAACVDPPSKLIMQLSDSGILIAPIGPDKGPQRLTLFQRIGQHVDTADLGPARFSAIVPGAAQNL